MNPTQQLLLPTPESAPRERVNPGEPHRHVTLPKSVTVPAEQGVVTPRSRALRIRRTSLFAVTVQIPAEVKPVGHPPHTHAELSQRLRVRPDDLAQQHGLSVWSLIRRVAGKPTRLTSGTTIGADTVTAHVRPHHPYTAEDLAQTLQQHCTIAGARVSVTQISR